MSTTPSSIAAGQASRYPDRSGSYLTWGRVLPAFVFQVLLLSKVVTLIHYLQKGPGDLSNFVFAVSAAQQTLGVLFLTFVVVLFVVRRPTIGQRSSLIGGIVAVAGSFIINLPVGARDDAASVGLLILSGALLLVGTAWSVVSVAYLGRCFGVFPEARGLVTRGPYRWVRHPVYLGELTAALGLVLASSSLAMWGAFVAMCGLQYWRANLEEASLCREIPEYATYARRTPRIVPFVPGRSR